jgi:hypothetical protein
MLKAETEEYEKIKGIHQGKFKQDPSGTLNPVFYKALKDLEEKGIPPQDWMSAEKFFCELMPWMETFSKTEDEWVGLIRNSFDKNFFKEGDSNRFNELIKIDKELTNLMFHSCIKTEIKNIKEKFTETSFRLCCIRSLSNPKSGEPDHYKILEPFKRDLDGIKSQIDSAYSLLDQMVNEVKRLTEKTNPAAILDDMTHAIDDIDLLEHRLKLMIDHSEGLDKEMQELLNKVRMFFSNRTEERKVFLAHIGDKNSEKLLTGPSFFHQKLMEFQKGVSTFVPSVTKIDLTGTIVIEDGTYF